MKTIVIMIIWTGWSQTQMMDTQRYDSIAECEAAKTVIANDKWGTFGSSIPADDIHCREVIVIDKKTDTGVPN